MCRDMRIVSPNLQLDLLFPAISGYGRNLLRRIVAENEGSPALNAYTRRIGADCRRSTSPPMVCFIDSPCSWAKRLKVLKPKA
jgi:hypothetical protein